MASSILPLLNVVDGDITGAAVGSSAAGTGATVTGSTGSNGATVGVAATPAAAAAALALAAAAAAAVAAAVAAAAAAVALETLAAGVTVTLRTNGSGVGATDGSATMGRGVVSDKLTLAICQLCQLLEAARSILRNKLPAKAIPDLAKDHEKFHWQIPPQMMAFTCPPSFVDDQHPPEAVKWM